MSRQVLSDYDFMSDQKVEEMMDERGITKKGGRVEWVKRLKAQDQIINHVEPDPAVRLDKIGVPNVTVTDAAVKPERLTEQRSNHADNNHSSLSSTVRVGFDTLAKAPLVRLCFGMSLLLGALVLLDFIVGLAVGQAVRRMWLTGELGLSYARWRTSGRALVVSSVIFLWLNARHSVLAGHSPLKVIKVTFPELGKPVQPQIRLLNRQAKKSRPPRSTSYRTKCGLPAVRAKAHTIADELDESTKVVGESADTAGKSTTTIDNATENADDSTDVSDDSTTISDDLTAIADDSVEPVLPPWDSNQTRLDALDTLLDTLSRGYDRERHFTEFNVQTQRISIDIHDVRALHERSTRARDFYKISRMIDALWRDLGYLYQVVALDVLQQRPEPNNPSLEIRQNRRSERQNPRLPRPPPVLAPTENEVATTQLLRQLEKLQRAHCCKLSLTTNHTALQGSTLSLPPSATSDFKDPTKPTQRSSSAGSPTAQLPKLCLPIDPELGEVDDKPSQEPVPIGEPEVSPYEDLVPLGEIDPLEKQEKQEHEPESPCDEVSEYGEIRHVDVDDLELQLKDTMAELRSEQESQDKMREELRDARGRISELETMISTEQESRGAAELALKLQEDKLQKKHQKTQQLQKQVRDRGVENTGETERANMLGQELLKAETQIQSETGIKELLRQKLAESNCDRDRDKSNHSAEIVACEDRWRTRTANTIAGMRQKHEAEEADYIAKQESLTSHSDELQVEIHRLKKMTNQPCPVQVPEIS